MKAVFYTRNQASGIHVHFSFNARCCYLPERKVVIAQESSGSFQNPVDCFNDSPEFVAEAEGIMNGIMPVSTNTHIPDPIISNISICELDDQIAHATVATLQSIRNLEEVVHANMELIFKGAK
jgi:hypothetical protein